MTNRAFSGRNRSPQNQKRGVCASALAWVLLTHSTQAAADYVAVDLNVQGCPTGIDASGMVAGSLQPTNAYRAGVDATGNVSLTVVPPLPGDSGAWGGGISAGVVVGTSFGSVSLWTDPRAFMLDPVGRQPIDLQAGNTIGAVETFATAINASLKVVGSYSTRPNQGQAFVSRVVKRWVPIGTTPGKGMYLGQREMFGFASVLGNPDSSGATAINDAGTVVGAVGTASGLQPFAIFGRNTAVIVALRPNSTDATFNAISSNGIMGGNTRGSLLWYSFLWQDSDSDRTVDPGHGMPSDAAAVEAG